MSTLNISPNQSGGSDDVITAANRASQIHRAVPEHTQRRTTIAVTETQEGKRIVSSSEKRLRKVQRDMLLDNEVEGVGEGHAEVTGVKFAKHNRYRPSGTAASRPICFACQSFLKEHNVTPLSELKQQKTKKKKKKKKK